MGRMPDLSGLFFLAMFGLACAAILIVGGGGWVAYHLFQALSLYLGMAP